LFNKYIFDPGFGCISPRRTLVTPILGPSGRFIWLKPFLLKGNWPQNIGWHNTKEAQLVPWLAFKLPTFQLTKPNLIKNQRIPIFPWKPFQRLLEALIQFQQKFIPFLNNKAQVLFMASSSLWG